MIKGTIERVDAAPSQFQLTNIEYEYALLVELL